MHAGLSTTEVFLIAIGIIFSVPYLICRLGKTDYYAPLVVVRSLPGSCWPRNSRQDFSRLLRVRFTHRSFSR